MAIISSQEAAGLISQIQTFRPSKQRLIYSAQAAITVTPMASSNKQQSKRDSLKTPPLPQLNRAAAAGGESPRAISVIHRRSPRGSVARPPAPLDSMTPRNSCERGIKSPSRRSPKRKKPGNKGISRPRPASFTCSSTGIKFTAAGHVEAPTEVPQRIGGCEASAGPLDSFALRNLSRRSDKPVFTPCNSPRN